MALILGPIVRLTETPGTLARVPVSGGAAREIAEGVFLADWSPDGTQLAVTRGTATGQVLEYPIGKKLFENNGFISGVKVSPKGDLVALVDNPSGGGFHRISGRHRQRREEKGQVEDMGFLDRVGLGAGWLGGLVYRQRSLRLHAAIRHGSRRACAPDRPAARDLLAGGHRSGWPGTPGSEPFDELTVCPHFRQRTGDRPLLARWVRGYGSFERWRTDSVCRRQRRHLQRTRLRGVRAQDGWLARRAPGQRLAHRALSRWEVGHGGFAHAAGAIAGVANARRAKHTR